MIGVFSSNDSLLDPSQPHRVPGAIDAGEDFTTSPTWNGGLPTDIPEDFFIDSILIQVPDSASFIFVSAHDSWYNDNTDPDNDFAVDMQITSTPIQVSQQHNGNFLKTYRLAQNYPNPFNPATYIEFQIPNSELVNLAVYDVLGRRVATLVDERLPAGVHKLQWNATGLSSGVYLYKLTVRQHTAIRKMVLVK
ncbi:MAG: T9SS type A sorting domain-containing protein [Aliifodinibius sp.]|nr:T9SS type A sorting domain-containing protein [Fodinibius sp.]NIY30322.1 T9SS type A sorting domain-containing protein [Fodinibius sp.]